MQGTNRTEGMSMGYGGNRQWTYFLGLGVVLVIVAILLGRGHPLLPFPWIVGLAMGFVLQRSRLCFAAAFRDALMFHDLGPARGVLLLLAVSTAGFALLQYHSFPGGGPLPGHIAPAGWYTVLGAALFGLGMVVSGGCAASTLVRMGEGFILFWWVGLGLAAGSLAGAYHYPWWQEVLAGRVVHLPAHLGWAGALAVQFLALAGLYGLGLWWERKG